MPVTLPPISRRRFLVSSLAAGVGMAIGSRWTWGQADGGRDPDRLVLLSDIHIAADPKTVAREVNMTEHLRQAVGEALALDRSGRKPSMVLVNGDCAFNTGETGDYANFVGLLRPLREAGWPVHIGLGNHDSRERFWEAVPAESERPVDGKQVMVLETPRVDWVMLDSLDKTNSTPGLLGEAQVKWLAQVLDDPRRKGKPSIVMVHHQPHVKEADQEMKDPATSKPMKIGGLVDTEQLMDVIGPRRDVKALVFGHTHVWSHKRMDNGLHLVNLPAVAYVFKPEQPSGWVDCVMGDGRAAMTLNCLDKKHPKHGETLKLEWRG